MRSRDETLVARAKADHQARVTRNPYVCPLPRDLEPPIRCRRSATRSGVGRHVQPHHDTSSSGFGGG